MGGISGKIEWSPVDMSDKTVIVTGANAGIGYETAKQLAVMGARVILACRDETRAQEAITRMNEEYSEANPSKSIMQQVDNVDGMADRKQNISDREETTGSQTRESGEQTTGSSEQTKPRPSLRLEFLRLDLSSLDSVLEFSSEFKSLGYPLHILICNAGIAMVPEGKTADGFENHFQINYLSHFLLIVHLLPVMRSSVGDCRIISVSSAMHRYGTLELTNIQAQEEYSGRAFYGNSKLFQIMMTYALERRLRNSHISVFSLHPGMIDSEIWHNFSDSTWLNVGVRAVRSLGLMKDTTYGAATSILLSVCPDLTQHSGSYYSMGEKIEPASQALNERDQEVLWKYSLECVGDKVSAELLQDLEI